MFYFKLLLIMSTKSSKFWSVFLKIVSYAVTAIAGALGFDAIV